jgi:hypothetical protein
VAAKFGLQQSQSKKLQQIERWALFHSSGVLFVPEKPV